MAAANPQDELSARPNVADPRATPLDYAILPPRGGAKLRTAWPLTGSFWFGVLAGSFLLGMFGLLSASSPSTGADTSLVVPIFFACSALAAVATISFAITITRGIYPMDRRPIRRARSLVMVGGAVVPGVVYICALLDRLSLSIIHAIPLCFIVLSITLYPFLFALWIGSRAD